VAVGVEEHLPWSVNPNLVRGEKAVCPWNVPHSPVQDFACVTAGIRGIRPEASILNPKHIIDAFAVNYLFIDQNKATWECT